MKDRLMVLWGCLVLLFFVTFILCLAAYGPALECSFLFGVIIFFIYYLVTPPQTDGLEKFRWFHKLSLALSIAATLSILVALSPIAFKIRAKLPYSFFIFLRWIVCAAFIDLLFFHLRLWFKALLLAGAVLYNPISMVHLGTRVGWGFCNIFTLSLFAVAWIVIIRGKNAEL